MKKENKIKGFSISTIVMMHLIQNYMNGISSWLVKASSIGGIGVHVFFFCSGFGLYLSWIHNKLSFKDFIKKRFVKIYVSYIMVVLLSACLPWMFDGTLQKRFMAVLSHVFLFKMFVPEFESSFGVQLWYISTIFQFYLLFIPLCIIKEKLGSKKFVGVCFVSSVLWWVFMSLTDWLWKFSNFVLFNFR